jgi:hypothetical protein
MEVGPNLVAFTLTKSVTLSASCFEEVGTLLCVTYMRNQRSANSARPTEKCCRKSHEIPQCDKSSQPCSEYAKNTSIWHMSWMVLANCAGK